MRNGGVSYWWQARGGFPPRRPAPARPLEGRGGIVGGEAAFAGYGASGRNGGWVPAEMPGSRARYARAAGGPAGVRALEAALRSTADEVGRVCADGSIDCDFVEGWRL